MGDGKNRRRGRMTALGFGVLGGIGGVGLALCLGFFGIAIGAAASAYPTAAKDAPAAAALLVAALVCLVAGLLDMVGSAIAWRDPTTASGPFVIAGGAFALAMALCWWAASMAGDAAVGALAVGCLLMAAVSPWWIRQSSR